MRLKMGNGAFCGRSYCGGICSIVGGSRGGLSLGRRLVLSHGGMFLFL